MLGDLAFLSPHYRQVNGTISPIFSTITGRYRTYLDESLEFFMHSVADVVCLELNILQEGYEFLQFSNGPVMLKRQSIQPHFRIGEDTLKRIRVQTVCFQQRRFIRQVRSLLFAQPWGIGECIFRVPFPMPFLVPC